MSQAFPTALATSRLVIRVLMFLNLLSGAAVLVLLALGPFLSHGWVKKIFSLTDDSTAWLALGVLGGVGLGSVMIYHAVLTRLLAMVETVRDGDPFVPENARRLRVAAWAILALQVLYAVAGSIAVRIVPTIEPDLGSSLNGWLTVILLFVLAQVFEHGTRMREDLQGTV